MFLYPYAITLSLLAICGKLFDNSRIVYNWVIGLTTVSCIFDLINALPSSVKEMKVFASILNGLSTILPFSELGLGWVVPSILGLVIGIVHYIIQKKKSVATC